MNLAIELYTQVFITPQLQSSVTSSFCHHSTRFVFLSFFLFRRCHLSHLSSRHRLNDSWLIVNGKQHRLLPCFVKCTSLINWNDNTTNDGNNHNRWFVGDQRTQKQKKQTEMDIKMMRNNYFSWKFHNRMFIFHFYTFAIFF